MTEVVLRYREGPGQDQPMGVYAGGDAALDALIERIDYVHLDRFFVMNPLQQPYDEGFADGMMAALALAEQFLTAEPTIADTIVASIRRAAGIEFPSPPAKPLAAGPC